MLILKPVFKSDISFRLYAKLIFSVFDRFTNLAKTRGLMCAVDDMKLSRLCFTRWMSKSPLKGKVGIPIGKSGLPKVLPQEVRGLLMMYRPIPLMKIVLTLLSFSRIVKGGKTPDK